MNIILAFIFGIGIGSFLNVLIWRLPREEGIDGRSKCPHCKHQLAWYDLVPLLSYAVGLGKCRYCRKPVSPRYPLIEVITGFLFAWAFYQFVPYDLLSGLATAQIMVALAVCVVVFVIDFEHYLILDKVVFPAAIIVAALILGQSLVAGSWALILSHGISAVAAVLPFLFIWWYSDGKWMGFGDVKFIAWMGLALGWPGIATALLLSFWLGAAVGIGFMVSGRKQLSSKLPFGTFLTVATVFTIFYGSKIWDAYWGMLGL